MTLTESFNKWLARIDHAGLPWQTSKDELLDIFTAGFHAGVESTKQVDLWAGTLSQDLRPAGVTGLAHRTCNAEESVRAGCGAPITADDIYAAYPRKVNPKGAKKAIQKAFGPGALDRPEYILAKTKEFAAAMKAAGKERQYIPHPQTWYNAGGWLSDPSEWGATTAPSQFRDTK